MSEAEGRKILMLKSKGLQVLDNLGELGKDEVKGALLEDKVGIVGDCSC